MKFCVRCVEVPKDLRCYLEVHDIGTSFAHQNVPGIFLGDSGASCFLPVDEEQTLGEDLSQYDPLDTEAHVPEVPHCFASIILQLRSLRQVLRRTPVHDMLLAAEEPEELQHPSLA